jgi:hypothetical protein
MSHHQRIGKRDKSGGALFGNCGEGAGEIIGNLRRVPLDGNTHSLSRGFGLSEFDGFAGVIWVCQYADAGGPGHGLFEQLDPLPGKNRREKGHTGRVPARARQTCNDSGVNRITAEPENNRDAFDGFGDDRSHGPDWNYEIDFEAKQFSDEFGNTIALSLGISVLDQKVLTFDVAMIAQALTKSLELW